MILAAIIATASVVLISVAFGYFLGVTRDSYSNRDE